MRPKTGANRALLSEVSFLSVSYCCSAFEEQNFVCMGFSWVAKEDTILLSTRSCACLKGLTRTFCFLRHLFKVHLYDPVFNDTELAFLNL